MTNPTDKDHWPKGLALWTAFWLIAILFAYGFWHAVWYITHCC